MALYAVNAVLTSVVAALMGFVVVVDWHNIRLMWRPMLIAGCFQQVILVYGCLEALDSQVPLEARQILFFGSIMVLMLAILLGITIGHRMGEYTLPFVGRREPK